MGARKEPIRAVLIPPPSVCTVSFPTSSRPSFSRSRSRPCLCSFGAEMEECNDLPGEVSRREKPPLTLEMAVGESVTFKPFEIANSSKRSGSPTLSTLSVSLSHSLSFSLSCGLPSSLPFLWLLSSLFLSKETAWHLSFLSLSLSPSLSLSLSLSSWVHEKRNIVNTSGTFASSFVEVLCWCVSADLSGYFSLVVGAGSFQKRFSLD